MNQTELSQTELRALFNTCNAEGKKMLEEKFGKEVFNKKLASFEECCAFNGVNPNDVIPFKEPKNDDERSVNAYAMMIQIVRARRNGKKIDWKNKSQYKYFNYYWMDGRSGSCLSLSDVGGGYSLTGVASRLHSLDEKTSREIFEDFPEVIEDFMVEKN